MISGVTSGRRAASPSRARAVVDAHMAAIRARDLEGIVATYAVDAVVADTDRIGRGHAHIRSVHAATLDAAADLEPELEILEELDVVFVTWHARRPHGAELVGTNTFVVDNGLIAVNTAFLTVGPVLTGRLDAGPRAEPTITRLREARA